MASIVYATLTARDSFNIGDEIQSIAVERLLPRVDTRIDRMDLASYESETSPTLLVMNGWFGPKGLKWPPSKAIRPLFYGFHVTDRHASRELILNPALRDYYEQFAPIGCRDRTTKDGFLAIGVDATTTWCATLTLRRRKKPPSGASEKVFLVDADFVPVPRAIRRRATRISHRVNQSFRASTKRATAEDLMDIFRKQARLVITTKIHCAMPCAAMGIPTVFIGNGDNPRLDPVRAVLPINDFAHSTFGVRRRIQRTAINKRFLWNVDWDPPAPEFEKQKQSMVLAFNATLEKALESRR